MSSLRELVWERAGDLCEYCRLPQSRTILPHEVDHIVAQQHHGQTVSDNLCLACALCNTFKGPNLAGIDPATGQMARLFHPRMDSWGEHFHWDGPILEGNSVIGRATIDVLKINLPSRVLLRKLSIEAGLFPTA